MGGRDAVIGTGVFSFLKLGTAAEEEPAVPVDEVIASTPDSVVLFISPGCGFCADAMAMMRQSGVPFVAVECSPGQRKELYQKTGSSSVPSAWVRGTYIGGCNDGPEEWMGVGPCLRSGKIEQMLGSEQ